MILKKLKKFAEKDYKGLSKNGAKELREIRNKLAEGLRKERKTLKERKSILDKAAKIGDKKLIDLSENVADLSSHNLENSRRTAAYKAWEAKAEILGKELIQAEKRKKLAEQLRRKKNLKIAGKTALGVGAVTGLAVGAKKLYDKNKKSKEFSETKENVSKGLAYGSTAAGLGALGATTASLGYNAKAVKRGLENSAAFEGKTLGELLKSKKFKDATTRVKRAINNREAKASNMAGKAGKIAGGLAAASIAMGAGSKLLRGKKEDKK